MERRISVEPTSNATESNVYNRGWLRIVAATARIAGLILLIVGLISPVTGMSPAYAGEDGLTWTVSEVNGKVWVDHDRTGWQALKTGTVLKRGSRVKTGMGGRVVLKRPGDSIAISPNSRFRIPTSDEKGRWRISCRRWARCCSSSSRGRRTRST